MFGVQLLSLEIATYGPDVAALARDHVILLARMGRDIDRVLLSVGEHFVTGAITAHFTI
jgi:hypothetical protein